MMLGSKTRKDLPFVLRKKNHSPIAQLEQSIQALLALDPKIRLAYDTESSYILDTGTGDNFVSTSDGYNLYPTEEKPSDYNVASLHVMSQDGRQWLKTHGERTIKSPLLRLKGMLKPFESEHWSPTFDERVYNVRSPLCDETLHKFLDGFNATTFRSSVTCFTPGMYLSPHIDIGPEFVLRLQVPIVTNSRCVMGFRRARRDLWSIYHFEPGYVYFVNTGWEHFARNDGSTDRYQIRVCLSDQTIIEEMEEVRPLRLQERWEL